MMRVKTPAVRTDRFENAARDPNRWIQASSRQFTLAARAWNRFVELGNEAGQPLKDEESVALLEGWLLHAGLTIELAAKAVIVRKDPSVVTANGFGEKSHDLVRLTERALGPVSANEREMLRRYSQAIEWTGRYPIPLTPETYELALREQPKIVHSFRDHVLIGMLVGHLHVAAR